MGRYKLTTALVKKFFNQLAKKEPNNFSRGIEKAYRKWGDDIYKEGSKKIKGTLRKGWKQAGGNVMSAQESGRKAGQKIIDPLTGEKVRAWTPEQREIFKQKTNEYLAKVKKGEVKPKGAAALNILKENNKKNWRSYTKEQAKFAQEYGGGGPYGTNVPLQKLRSDPAFLQAWHLRRAEDEAIKQGFYTTRTPATQLLKKYGEDPLWKDIVTSRQAWTDVVTPGRDAFYEPLSKEMQRQGITSIGKFSAENPWLAGAAHQLGIAQPFKYFKGMTPRNMTATDMIKIINDPANIGVEYNFMNPSMNALQRYFSTPELIGTNFGRLPKMLDDAQVGIKYFDDEGILQALGKTDRQIDPEKMTKYLQYIEDNRPFGTTKGGNPRYVPIKEHIRRLILDQSPYSFKRGGKVQSYAAREIARLAIKMLERLAKKMPEEDFLKLTETLFKGTKPLMGPKYKRQIKLAQYLRDKYGKKTTWPFVKSEVPGPKSSLKRKQEQEFFDNTEFWPYKGMGE